ncbi:MAG: ion channel [bacterium]
MILFSLRKIRTLVYQLQQHNLIEKKILKAVFLVFALNLLFGGLFYLAEHTAQPQLTLSDAIWWAIVTMTTVGYGDVAAVTPIGRFVISYLCMFLGIGIIGSLIGFLAERIIQNISKKRRGLMKIMAEDHLIICSFPGENKIIEVVNELRAAPQYKNSVIVLITDDLEELPESLNALKIRFLKGIPTDEDVLFKANILGCKGVLILADQNNSQASDERSFAIGMIIELIEKKHQRPIKTVVEVVSRKNLKLIQRSDVDGMISNDGITSRMLVQEFLYPGIHDVFQQLLSNFEGSQFYLFPTKLIGRKVIDIQREILNHPADIQVIGIIKGQKKILNPSKRIEIEAGDQLILLAENLADFDQIEASLLGVP